MNRRFRKMIDEPTMSDNTLLLTVEDLISTAFGPLSKNAVNFKLIQTILHILARQLRLLEQNVEIKFDEVGIALKQDDKVDEYDAQSTYSSSYSGRAAEGKQKDVEGGRGRERKVRDTKDEKKDGDDNGEKGEKKDRVKKDDKGEKIDDKGTKKDDKREKIDDKGTKKDVRGKKKDDKRETIDDIGAKKDYKGGKKDYKREKKDVKRAKKDDKGEKKDDPGEIKDDKSEKKDDKGEKKDDTGEIKDDKREKKDVKGAKKDDKVEKKDDTGKIKDDKGEIKDDKGEKKDVKGAKKDDKVEKKDDTGKIKDDKGEKKERDEKGEAGTKKERGEKDEKTEKQGRTSSKDREKKEGSMDRKTGKKGDVDKGEERDGGHGSGRTKRSKDRDEDAGGKRQGESRGRSAARESSRSSITITEAVRKRTGRAGTSDTILVAERGPTARSHGTRVGSIEVVTASQFALLEKTVKQLQQVSGPLPMPALPDNEQLRKDLAQGRASLSETMQAVQLNARVQAAEQGLFRMAGLLTQLAAKGALPRELADSIEEMQTELQRAASAGGFGGAVPEFGGAVPEFGGAVPKFGGPSAGHARAGEKESGDDEGGRTRKQTLADPLSAASRKQTLADPLSATSRKLIGGGGTSETEPRAQGVTHVEMQNVLEFMKEELNKNIINLTGRANHSADMASKTSRSVAEKLAVALHIDARITSLYSQTDDYAEQLSGFDSGLTTQMTSFQEQMTQINTGLREGLAILETVNNNAETAAVLDLTERYEGIVLELDNTVHLHKHLVVLQEQLSDELRSLVECVEMLREQKADRDEVLDGLRDKADISRLAGLLYEKDFAQARLEIETRLDKCYEKFNKQDLVWQNALKDLSLVSDNKAELIVLMALKDSTTQELNSIQTLLRRLEIMLGEPKAALLMRKLAKDSACGACLTRGLMPLTDAAHGLPKALPPLRGAPRLTDPCLADLKLRPSDNRDHICHRWVGGSHTMIAGNVLRVKAGEGEIDLQIMPTKKFEGYGIDGKLYMMEEDILPCAECNQLSTDNPSVVPPHSPVPTGGGDQA